MTIENVTPLIGSGNGTRPWSMASIDCVSVQLGKLWGILSALESQFWREVPKAERCEWIWTSTLLAEVRTSLQEIDSLCDEGPMDVNLAVHKARALAELLISSEISEGDGEHQHLGDELLEWLIWDLRDRVQAAKDAVDASTATARH